MTFPPFKYRNKGKNVVIPLTVDSTSKANINSAIRQIDNLINDLKDMEFDCVFVANESLYNYAEKVILERALLFVPEYSGALRDSGYVKRVKDKDGIKIEVGFADYDYSQAQQRAYISSARADEKVIGGETKGVKFPSDERNPKDYAAIVHEEDPAGGGKSKGFLRKAAQGTEEEMQNQIVRSFKQRYTGGS